ncbi:hypothetical protein EJ357_14885 [Streptomyces cyaneochromogenes]|uniref:Uncharacterized protein n=1 Tax=Streptomyces cyaneochromogenes TaxID=2496836 RepID=A0A3Q9ESL4_9ACTN|nr:hypothetical protein [Streptomyces cyaneochromogenes]AZQ34603.1 hypothetical protein EJ357_14885 [Streptomyces cyaneochromogenes]
MSMSVGLSIDVSGLRPGEETAHVAEALTAFLTEHDLDGDMTVGVEAPGQVSAWSEYPIIVTRFGAWADKIEQESQNTVREVAPAAQVDVRWSFEDEDD